ncbi:MAG: heme-binding domain-containing protein [Anaerolineae bacterium]|nr:heme-binding domain-containing protein [Anaerolineae bacterium]
MIVVAVLVVGALLIQVLPVAQRTNPPVTLTVNWDSPDTEALARAACFDCHSNETVWPWYGYIAPVSWVLINHVEEGRYRLNFSTGQGEADLHDLIDQVEEGSMPPGYYKLMHPAANLSDAQRQQLIAGFRATFPNGFGEGG